MFRVRTTFSGWNGGPGVQTCYFVVPTYDQTAAARVRQYVHDLMGTALGQLGDTGNTWTVQNEVDVLDPVNGQTSATFSDGTAHTSAFGGGAGSAPTAAAALIRWSTDDWFAGRHIMGRSYVSPIASAIVDADGAISSAVTTAVDADLGSYLAALDSGDSQHVWHRPKMERNSSGVLVQTRDGASVPITSATCRTKIAVLTSRRD